MLLGKQDSIRGKKAEGTLGRMAIQKAKLKSNTDGWRHINRALIEQGERKKEGRIKEEERTGLSGDKMCP